mmetsp:Transcript_16045/g.29244  ORF Transcript_16045/g.29244 Transcript_16045/m.29244 type:complete len:585 (-) Transcript_16045:285-2039(-)
MAPRRQQHAHAYHRQALLGRLPGEQAHRCNHGAMRQPTCTLRLGAAAVDEGHVRAAHLARRAHIDAGLLALHRAPRRDRRRREPNDGRPMALGGQVRHHHLHRHREGRQARAGDRGHAVVVGRVGGLGALLLLGGLWRGAGRVVDGARRHHEAEGGAWQAVHAGLMLARVLRLLQLVLLVVRHAALACKPAVARPHVAVRLGIGAHVPDAALLADLTNLVRVLVAELQQLMAVGARHGPRGRALAQRVDQHWLELGRLARCDRAERREVGGEGEGGGGGLVALLHARIGTARPRRGRLELLLEDLAVEVGLVGLAPQPLLPLPLDLLPLAPHDDLSDLIRRSWLDLIDRLLLRRPALAGRRTRRVLLLLLLLLVSIGALEQVQVLLVVEESVAVRVAGLEEVDHVLAREVGGAEPPQRAVDFRRAQQAVVVRVEGHEGLPQLEAACGEGLPHEHRLRALLERGELVREGKHLGERRLLPLAVHAPAHADRGAEEALPLEGGGRLEATDQHVEGRLRVVHVAVEETERVVRDRPLARRRARGGLPTGRRVKDDATVARHFVRERARGRRRGDGRVAQRDLRVAAR